jgi:glycosyltransferase involved in cell wall biosynthesis
MGERSTKPQIAIVCDTVPYPPRSGDNQRIAELIHVMRQSGWFVHLVLATLVDKQARLLCQLHVDELHSYSGAGLRTRLRTALRLTVRSFDRLAKRIGLPPAEEMASRILGRRIAPIFLDYWRRYPQGLDGYIAKLARSREWQAVIVEYLWLYPAIRELPGGIQRLLDTHDIQHRRVEEFASRGLVFPMKVSRDEESRIFRQFDAVIAIQSAEAALIREMCPEMTVLSVGSMGYALGLQPVRPIAGRILYVGGYNAANVDGLKRFLESIWPQVVSECPKVSLHICGHIFRAFLGEQFVKVTFRGHLEDLTSEYAAAIIAINPCWIGTGLKIKTVDALARGKPLVTTAKGIEGMHGDVEQACVIANSNQAFAAALIHILKDPQERRRLSEAALTFSGAQLSAETVYRELLDFLDAKK